MDQIAEAEMLENHVIEYLGDTPHLAFKYLPKAYECNQAKIKTEKLEIENQLLIEQIEHLQEENKKLKAIKRKQPENAENEEETKCEEPASKHFCY